MTKITRTRFAPSPTGYLHVGGARTALFSWLYAKKQGGKFILRIEDTDLERSTQESVDAIFDGMNWLGLTYDEGPIYQSRRVKRHEETIQQLLEQGDAYCCICSKEELDQKREEQRLNKEKPRYTGKCREANYSQRVDGGVIRFKNPEKGEVVINDLIKGTITVSNEELDDLIIARSDGSPTYNLTVVVDDLDMDVTHVIRGDDHINNTPRQINILNALGADLPEYAHAPMILGADGARLSKRHGAVSVMQYRDEGYLSGALLNYLVRLGWSYGDQEIFSLNEMTELFELGDVNVSASTFNPEKLLWLNHQYIMNSDPEYVAKQLEWHMDDQGVEVFDGPDLVDIVKAQRERCKTLVSMLNDSLFFFREFDKYNEKAVKKNFKQGTDKILQRLFDEFSLLQSWDGDALQEIVVDTAREMEVGLGKVAQPLRVAVSGTSVSPSIDTTLLLLGRDKTLSRIQRAIEFIRGLSSAE